MTRWLQVPVPRPAAAIRLVCLPHAGGGAGIFRPWAAELPPQIELVAVRLPGRESRLAEPLHRDWPALLADVAAELVAAVEPPYALFGHSFGAMLGYELSLLLAEPPRRLFLAGCLPPGVARPLPNLAGLPAPELLAGLRRFDALPEEVAQSESLLELLLPMLRADLGLAESWPQRPARRVAVPVTVLTGQDDPIAPPAGCAAWAELAGDGFEQHTFAGGHFFPHDQRSAVLPVVASTLTAEVADVG